MIFSRAQKLQLKPPLLRAGILNLNMFTSAALFILAEDVLVSNVPTYDR